MKIIKAGKLPEKEVFQCTCSNCKTQFEFERGEAKYVPDQRDGDMLAVTCPFPGCNKTNHVNLRYYRYNQEHSFDL